MTASAVPAKSDPNCLFCKIVEQKIPAQRVSENEHSIAIRDVNPQAPTHILVLPKTHLPNIAEAAGNAELVSKLIETACNVAKEQNLDKGFRLVINTGNDGGQTVHHLHIHLLGGRFMGWPPG
jgi:histidine triad (HIT) family protein